MENYIFLYVQNGQEKSMQIRLPIGTQVTFEAWKGLFSGFEADLLKFCKYSDIVGSSL